MKKFVLIALACFAAAGCKKYLETSQTADGNQGGGAQGGGGGAVMAVHGAVQRTVTAAELKDLHLFMKQAQLSNGRVPTAQETWAAISQPGGNPKLTQLIKDGILVLVPNPPEEGLWAYDKNAATQGGWVLTHSEPRRVTPQEFAQLNQQ
jgi:hypothetical protein